jgi:hypothetical protein
MSYRVAAVLLANLLMLGVGAGLLPLLGLARTRAELVARLGVAYMVGVVAVGALSLYLALLTGAVGLDLGFGAVGLLVTAVAALVLGLRRLPAGRIGRPSLALVALVPAAAMIVHAARAFAVHPLSEYDGWVIWATKARALADFGRVYAPVFAGDPYRSIHLDYPLLFPSLEAVDLRTMGSFDGTALHVQLALLLAGFVAALWSLARPYAWALVTGACALAVAVSPQVLAQLSTNYADVPLAFFVALGVAALAAWVDRAERPLLVAAAVFLAGACLTKNEGSVFALAAFVAAAALSRRWRAVGIAALAVLAAELPWRIWVAAHGLHSQDFQLTNALDPGYLSRHTDRLGPAVHELWNQLGSLHDWGYLLPLTAIGMLAALALRRFALAAFAATWLALSFGGLLLVYWIAETPLDEQLFNTANRTIMSLVVGGAALVPLLVGRPA